ncbi:tachykinin-like peptides receptor 86C, partial [Pollicipes pollicipes]|uniref:tachykinin-like peptides receptor 86C n=1 Tax=Pollicipes pollicipes TaxID=41117 RepID=UPI0018849F65
MLEASSDIWQLRLLLEHNFGAQAGARPDGFAMASWAALGWAVAFGAMLVIAIAGNSLVCAIILTHNCFLANLSVANLLMISLELVPSTSFYVVYADWRYMVIVRGRCTARIRRDEVVGCIILIWVCSGCLSVPHLLYSGHRHAPHCTDSHCGSLGRRRGGPWIARKFIVVVVAFALLWLPHQVSCVYTYHDLWLAQRKYVQHLILGFYWLAMSHSMVNPFIYFWKNGRFRSCLAGWCCRSDKHSGMDIKVQVPLAGMTPAALPTGKRKLMLMELGV